MTVNFYAHGLPRPGGSKRSFIPGLRAGATFDPKRHRPIITDDCKRNKEWRESVKEAAIAVCPTYIFTCPLLLVCVFFMPRPKSHYRTGKHAHVLRADAPFFHTTRPDATKLLRSTEDALTGVLWRDDAQIAVQVVAKVYTSGRPGADITVEELDEDDREARLMGAIAHLFGEVEA